MSERCKGCKRTWEDVKKCSGTWFTDESLANDLCWYCFSINPDRKTRRAAQEDFVAYDKKRENGTNFNCKHREGKHPKPCPTCREEFSKKAWILEGGLWNMAYEPNGRWESCSICGRGRTIRYWDAKDNYAGDCWEDKHDCQPRTENQNFPPPPPFQQPGQPNDQVPQCGKCLRKLGDGENEVRGIWTIDGLCDDCHHSSDSGNNHEENQVPSQHEPNQQYPPEPTPSNSPPKNSPSSNSPAKPDQAQNPTNWTPLIFGILGFVILVIITILLIKNSLKKKNL